MSYVSAQSRMAVVALISIACMPAWAIDPATIASQGSGQVPACASCHGKDGGGQASFPRLAGMNAAYLLKQLDDFAGGSRDNAVMKPIAMALSAKDRKALAAYYAGLPIAKVVATASPIAAGTAGERLATRGAWSRGVPACVQCHGPGGVGVGANFPALAGQSAGYISAQLQAWQKGSRKNDPLELMRHLAARLDAGEVQAVSDWFAAQPATTPGTQP